MLSIGVRGASFSEILTKFGQIQLGAQCRNEYTMFGHGMGNRHRDPKWKKHRANKVMRVKLPEYERMRDKSKGKVSREEVTSL